MPHPLNSAREKLKRAEENILNLDKELKSHLAELPTIYFEGVRPSFTVEQREAWAKLQRFAQKELPERFGTLAGEIVHHMRSALDHIAWQLSDAVTREPVRNSIEFPILKDNDGVCGLKKDRMCRFCRKVQCITSPTALARIEELQPYWRSTPLDDPLWLVHDMDRIDKHRTLVVIAVAGHIPFQAVVTKNFAVRKHETNPEFRQAIPILGTSNVTVKGEISLDIAFREFGTRKDQFVIPSLRQLLDSTRNVVESFAGEFS